MAGAIKIVAIRKTGMTAVITVMMIATETRTAKALADTFAVLTAYLNTAPLF